MLSLTASILYLTALSKLWIKLFRLGVDGQGDEVIAAAVSLSGSFFSRDCEERGRELSGKRKFHQSVLIGLDEES